MKAIASILMVLAASAVAQTTVSITVTLTPDQVWALTQDWNDYNADTNNAAMAKIPWFTMNATNQIHAAANRRVQVRKQDHLRSIAERWNSLTPAQQSNVVAALPAP